MPTDLIKATEVLKLTGLNRKQLDALVKASRFPPPYIKSPRYFRWERAEVLNWIQHRPEVIG